MHGQNHFKPCLCISVKITDFILADRRLLNFLLNSHFFLLYITICAAVSYSVSIIVSLLQTTYLLYFWSDSDRASSLICGNKMPTRCNRWYLLQILLLGQHVSGTIMPIIRSSRVLYRWSLPVVFGALVLKLSVWCGAEGYMSGLRAAAVRSQPVYCADVYRERRYQMLCEYNFSSWGWAC